LGVFQAINGFLQTSIAYFKGYLAELKQFLPFGLQIEPVGYKNRI